MLYNASSQEDNEVYVQLSLDSDSNREKQNKSKPYDTPNSIVLSNSRN